jgi:hypothetical protein
MCDAVNCEMAIIEGNNSRVEVVFIFMEWERPLVKRSPSKKARCRVILDICLKYIILHGCYQLDQMHVNWGDTVDEHCKQGTCNI